MFLKINQLSLYASVQFIVLSSWAKLEVVTQVVTQDDYANTTFDYHGDVPFRNLNFGSLFIDSPHTVHKRQVPPTREIDLSTSMGMVRGTIDFSEAPTYPPSIGRHYYSFRGIPFAMPPLGTLRWEIPQEWIGGWPGGLLVATQHRPFCPQWDHDNNVVVGSEDCLYLNIYTPYLPGQTQVRLPVLVFLHGGAYIRGASSSHGPQKLMREDLVIVTPNYRLGVLGFLSSDTSTLPGNYGLFDQLAALRWVNKHIAEFGGDPSRVTLGGFSAGAAMVHMHMLSPLSRGLFHGAIMMSGAANCLWSIAPYPNWDIHDLAWDLSCPRYSAYAIRYCLERISAMEILRAVARRHKYVFFPMIFRPVIDGGLRENPFLPEPLHNLTRHSVLSPVPLLIGGVPDEGLLFALTTVIFSEGGPSQIFNEAVRYPFSTMWYNHTFGYAKAVGDAFVSHYYSRESRDSFDTLVEEMTEAYTDMMFTSCIWDTASFFSSSSRVPVFSYVMSHHDPTSPSFSAPLMRLAAARGVQTPLLQRATSHGDDVALIFSFPYELGTPGPRDQQMSAILTAMWANFIRTGTPQGVPGTALASLPPWIPLVAGEPANYYRLSLVPAMSYRPFRNKERNFWRTTLPLVEYWGDPAYRIATWFLLIILLILLFVLLIACLCARRSRRRRKYAEGGIPKLRSRLPRSASATTGSPTAGTDISGSGDPRA